MSDIQKEVSLAMVKLGDKMNMSFIEDVNSLIREKILEFFVLEPYINWESDKKVVFNAASKLTKHRDLIGKLDRLKELEAENAELKTKLAFYENGTRIKEIHYDKMYAVENAELKEALRKIIEVLAKYK